MIVMADMFIYLLLGLLLDGDSTYYGLSSGTGPSESYGLTKNLLFFGRYIWLITNIVVVLLLVYKKFLGPMRGITKARNILKQTNSTDGY